VLTVGSVGLTTIPVSLRAGLIGRSIQRTHPHQRTSMTMCILKITMIWEVTRVDNRLSKEATDFVNRMYEGIYKMSHRFLKKPLGSLSAEDLQQEAIMHVYQLVVTGTPLDSKTFLTASKHKMIDIIRKELSEIRVRRQYGKE